MKQKINNFFALLREKRKVVISNPSSFQEKFAITLSRSGYILVIFLSILLIAFITYLTISYTSLRKYIPGYPDIDNIDQILETDKENLSLINSVDQQNKQRDLWIKNLQNILSNNDSVLLPQVKEQLTNDSLDYKNIIFERSLADSLLRKKVEIEEKLIKQNEIKGILRSLNFLSPVEGNPSAFGGSNSFGVKYKTLMNTSVQSCMKGVVISTSKNMATIQHSENLISIYKSCTDLTVKPGDEISRGKEIGNTLDSTFHFELWHKGKPVELNKIVEN